MKIKNTTNLLLLTCLLSLSSVTLAQTQLGLDLDGEAAGDRSGEVSISSDGSRLAIGALGNDGNGENSGHVRVYQWSGTAWLQLGTDIDGEAADDRSGFGMRLSSDGSRLAIGAQRNDGNGIDSGHVRVYQWSGTAWIQLGSDIDGEAAGDNFGQGISWSSDGNRLAIGGRFNNDNGSDAGHVRVYQWSGTAWVQLGTDIDGEAADDLSGYSISLSSEGDRLAIGAFNNDGNGTDSGHVRVYQWSGTAWLQLGSDIDGDAAEDRFGRAVSLSSDGNRLAIAGKSNDRYVTYSSYVRVFQWSGTAWAQLGTDIDGDAIEDEFGGVDVSMTGDGNRIAIGTSFDDGNGSYSGNARVYQWSGTAWLQLGSDIDGEAAGDNFGRVSLSSEGNRLAIGASRNGGNGVDSGHVRVYDLSMFNAFSINPGLNDAWYYPETNGQGFFITVFPGLGYVSMAWFTYDTELPPLDATANLGDAGHRWITAVGPYVEDKAILEIEMTSGGIFDAASEITRTDPPGTDGTITLTFDNCESGMVEYDIPSINRTGVVPIQRVAGDNVVLCQVLNEALQNPQ